MKIPAVDETTSRTVLGLVVPGSVTITPLFLIVSNEWPEVWEWAAKHDVVAATFGFVAALAIGQVLRVAASWQEYWIDHRLEKQGQAWLEAHSGQDAQSYKLDDKLDAEAFAKTMDQWWDYLCMGFPKDKHYVGLSYLSDTRTSQLFCLTTSTACLASAILVIVLGCYYASITEAQTAASTVALLLAGVYLHFEARQYSKILARTRFQLMQRCSV